jgi:hypothetical protein
VQPVDALDLAAEHGRQMMAGAGQGGDEQRPAVWGDGAVAADEVVALTASLAWSTTLPALPPSGNRGERPWALELAALPAVDGERRDTADLEAVAQLDRPAVPGDQLGLVLAGAQTIRMTRPRLVGTARLTD